jgi:hypothetical protein
MKPSKSVFFAAQTYPQEAKFMLYFPVLYNVGSKDKIRI